MCSNFVNHFKRIALLVNMIGMVYVNHFKRKRLSTLTSYNFHSATPILKIEMTIYMFCNC